MFLMICTQHNFSLSIKQVSIDQHFVRAKFDLAVPVLTSLVKFYSCYDIANSVQVCASNRYRSSLIRPRNVNICIFVRGCLCTWQQSFSYGVCIQVFDFARQLQLSKMKGRRPSTSSASSRTGLLDSPGRKMLSEVLLVCELLLFITLAALTGGKPNSTSTHGQKKGPQVRTVIKPTKMYFIFLA